MARIEGVSTFFEESPLPNTSNLISHTAKCPNKHSLDDAAAVAIAANPSVHSLRDNTALFGEWIAKGVLNPAVNPTKQGFLRVFAAWLIRDSMPWTTGESEGLKDLFKYLCIDFSLPSDTTVRNALGRIYIELHDKVVSELSVSTFGLKTACRKLMEYSTSSLRSHTLTTPGLPSR